MGLNQRLSDHFLNSIFGHCINHDWVLLVSILVLALVASILLITLLINWMHKVSSPFLAIIHSLSVCQTSDGGGVGKVTELDSLLIYFCALD